MGAILGQKGPSALCPLSPRDLLGSGLYGGLEVSHSSLVATPSRGPTPTRASQPAREELPLAFARPGPTWASPNHARNGKESPVALSVAPPQPQALSPTSGHPPRWPGQAPTSNPHGPPGNSAGSLRPVWMYDNRGDTFHATASLDILFEVAQVFVDVQGPLVVVQVQEGALQRHDQGVPQLHVPQDLLNEAFQLPAPFSREG